MLYESANLRVEADDQIATLWLDFRGRRTNAFTLGLLDDLDCCLQTLQGIKGLDVLVIRSAKPGVFSTGHDLREFASLHNEPELAAFAARGQQVLRRLEGLSPALTTVALLDGPCLGAGLELALACDYRLALARPTTAIGFPEVRRGLVPCWGGTQRLPGVVGLRAALDMLLTGRTLSGREARACGLVDHAFCERRAPIELRSFLDTIQDAARPPERPRRVQGFWRRLRDENALGRWLSFRFGRRLLEDVPEEDRPAAHEALRAVELGLGSPAEGLARERSAVAKLARTPACRNALQLALRAEQPAKIYPEPVNPVPALPERVGVVGGGDLGASLVRWLALRGREVILREKDVTALAAADRRLEALFAEAVARGWATPLEAQQANRSVKRTLGWQGFDHVGLVIEAADEDLGVKRGVFNDLEENTRPRTILATAGSTVRVEALQAELRRPGRVAGLHFLAPMDAVPLVEIVRAPATDPDTLAALDAWVRALGRSPVLVSDRPGRIALRLQLAYLSEAVLLVAEGLPPHAIDRAMRRFGMPRGPLETIDAIGFDRLAELVENLRLARGDDFARNLLLERMRALGWQGRANEGFYRYRRGRSKPNDLARMVMWQDFDEEVVSHYIFDPDEALSDGAERLVLRTVNEAAACLSEERSADPATIDLALALGTDWAPHLGGPLRYADSLGLNAVVGRLAEFAERFGRRFVPNLELQRRAEAGESFYGSPAEVVRPAPVPWRMAG